MAKTIIIGSNLNRTSISRQFVALAEKLAEEGFNIIFISQVRLNKKTSSASKKITFLQWPNYRPTKIKDFIFYLKLLIKYEPTLTISNFGSTNVMVILGWLTRCPVRIVWYHTIYGAKTAVKNYRISLRDIIQKFRKKFIYQFATHVVPVSDAALEDLVKNFNVPPEKCLVFYNSIVPPGVVTKKNYKKIICLGKLLYNKGQDIFIKAAQIVSPKFPDYTFEIIGSGEMENDYRNLINQSGFSDKIIIKPEVTVDQVYDLFGSCYLSVVPSRFEAFGLVVIESMSVGTPVVASKVGGIPEIIEDGKEGLLFEKENYKEMADKILYLLENPEARTAMANNARQKFLAKFDQKTVIKEQVGWINDLILLTKS